jgi:hypothetical protein
VLSTASESGARGLATAKGHTLLGLPRRRAPRAELQREHEAAKVWHSTRLELEDDARRVLTERECRRAEALKDGRYSVELAGFAAAK